MLWLHGSYVANIAGDIQIYFARGFHVEFKECKEGNGNAVCFILMHKTKILTVPNESR